MVLYRHLISCLHKNKVKVSFNVHVLKLIRNKVENEALHCLNVLKWKLYLAYHLLGTII